MDNFTSGVIFCGESFAETPLREPLLRIEEKNTAKMAKIIEAVKLSRHTLLPAASKSINYTGAITSVALDFFLVYSLYAITSNIASTISNLAYSKYPGPSGFS